MRLGNRVLVTGPTGFIGAHVVSALVQDGFSVSVATRRASSPDPAIRTFLIDTIDGRTDWGASLENIDSVVHLAGRAHRRAEVQKREADHYSAVNVDGTHHLASAAARAGVRRFVYLSSIAVNGAMTRGRPPFRPDDVPAPKTFYGVSKLRAELALAEIQAGSPGLSVDILRCPVVIGRDAPGNLALLAWALKKGLPLPFASVRNQRAFLAIDDLSDFIALRLNASATGCCRFTLGSADTVSTPQLVRLMAGALRCRPNLMPAPPAGLRALLILAGRRDKADAIVESLEIDVGAAKLAGWQPKVSIAEAVNRAFG
ncbi:NAD-dependent epimerase/dehydratase family protein [Phreatobacter aquaticus]|uniref:NAD-dependent epimerase/dehydratase family protein n=1 Tax=Phreatobacter aquaticus TaxID=2570229 RepID=A0A4D7QNX8_9HYPH|nr:NAD-dependent epimerase/dehydratase family protein [Phreatobacter aquaticus]QCK87613.1 NAD-dependent epimerase/dehydratase family protein [Phreatobacter aquaticus]